MSNTRKVFISHNGGALQEVNTNIKIVKIGQLMRPEELNAVIDGSTVVEVVENTPVKIKKIVKTVVQNKKKSKSK